MKKKTKVSRKKAIKIDETTKKMKGIRSVKKKTKIVQIIIASLDVVIIIIIIVVKIYIEENSLDSQDGEKMGKFLNYSPPSFWSTCFNI